MTVAHHTWQWDGPAAEVAVPAYRGPDRRRAAITAPSTRTSGWTLALYLVLSHLAVLASATLGSQSANGRAELVAWLTASVAVISALASVIFALRWRLTGDASSIWIAGALLVYSATNIAFPGLVASFSSTGSGVGSLAEVLRPVSVIVVIGLLTIAVSAPPVDARLRPGRVALIAGGVAAIGLVVTLASPGIRLLFGPAVDRAPSTAAGGIGQVGVGIVWLLLAVGFVRRSGRDGLNATRWIGIMLIGLAEARLTLGIAVRGDASWMLASQLARLLGVTAALVGAVNELQASFTRQQTTLLESLVELGSTRARRHAELASAQERAHDLRAALLGMSSAAVTLERYHDQLDVDERTELARAVGAEIARLQEIVSDTRLEPPRSFAIADAMRPMLMCASAKGMRINVEIPADLQSFGRPSDVVEACQNLVDNAFHHAPGSPVDVRATTRDDAVELRVEDRGPGIPAAIGDLVFERGWRGDDGVDGSGLGLYLAARLVKEQNGELRVEERPGGGASFVMTLPRATGEKQ